MNISEQIINSSKASPLVYGAVGDAYGFCFEFTSEEFTTKNNNLNFHQHPEFLHVRPGAYSDDTQMQMALAEIIASERDWSPIEIAKSFIDVFKRDPRPGYARHFADFLNKVSNPTQFLKEMNPSSERNGAAMRAPIIGLYPDLNIVVQRAEIQAKITHDTKGGVDSAIASSLLCHYFAYDLGPKDALPSFLNQNIPGYDWSPTWQGKVPVHGISTVKAAIRAVVESDSLSELLKKCVSFTGDVDSVATIALASASCHANFKRDIPLRLFNEIENGDYGISYLINLEEKVRNVINLVK